MKKKILSIVGVAAFAVAVAFNINAGLNVNNQMDITMENMEALGQGEDITIECTQSNCRGGKCHWSTHIPSCPCEANGYTGWTCNNWSGI